MDSNVKADLTSKKPYFLRAFHEWCSANGLTPQLVVKCDESVVVPPHYVQAGEIVLNVSKAATADLQIGNERITFRARFNGTVWDILVPTGRVVAIFARESGEAMNFALEDPVVVNLPAKPALSVIKEDGVKATPTPEAARTPSTPARPTLTRIK